MIQDVAVAVSVGLAVVAGVNALVASRKAKDLRDDLNVRVREHGLEIVVKRDEEAIDLHELDPQMDAEIKSRVEHAIETMEAESEKKASDNAEDVG